jgi:stage V sporulation protein B
LEICEVDVLPEVESALEPKSYARRFAKGSAIVFAAFIASEVIGVFLRIFLARSLTVAEYGLFYAVFTLASFFVLFRDLGLNNALGKYIPEFIVHKQFAKIKSSIASVLLVQVAFGFIVSAALFLFSDHIALAIFRDLAASLPLRILSVWFFVAMLYTLMQTTFQGFQDMPAYASISVFGILSILLLVMLFVGILGLGVVGVALAYLLAAVVIGFFGLTLFIRRYPHVFQEKASVTKPLLKKLFVFALPLLIGSVAGLIISYTDTIMITIFRNLTEVGFYQVAQPTARILWYIPLALTVILFPMISELWTRRKRALLGEMLHFLIKFSFIIIMPITFTFIAFPEIVINLLYGPGYLAGTTALQILAVTAIVYTPFIILAEVMRGTGRPVILMKVVGFMACLNIVGNLALIPPYGIEGAAVATFAAHLLGLLLLAYYSRKLVKFSMPLSSLLKTLVGGTLTLLLIFSLKFILVLSPWLKAFAVMIPSLLFYVAWILATKAITRDDLKLINEIVPMPRWLVRITERFLRG